MTVTSTPILIDTDPGIDDTIAIVLALASPELSVQALLTVCGNVPVDVASHNALRVLELAGRADIPVFAGSARPLLGEPIYGLHHGPDGLGGARLPSAVAPLADQHAVEYLMATLEDLLARGERITICALGPMTNIALALRIRPRLADAIERIVAMGGAFRTPGNRTFTSEFNILADAHAAQIVFSSGVPITLLPLDVTHQAMATPERIARLRTLGGPVMETLGQMMVRWDRKDEKRYGTAGGPMHDPLVTAYLLAPHLFKSRPARVHVECDSALCKGQTVADWFGKSHEPPNVDVVTDVDAEGFFALLEAHLRQVSLVSA